MTYVSGEHNRGVLVIKGAEGRRNKLEVNVPSAVAKNVKANSEFVEFDFGTWKYWVYY